MLLLALMLQSVEADEVATPARLMAPRPCTGSRDEITVCANARDSNRIGHEPPKPDPMFADRRPRIKLSDHVAIRVGFMTSLEIH